MSRSRTSGSKTYQLDKRRIRCAHGPGHRTAHGPAGRPRWADTPRQALYRSRGLGTMCGAMSSTDAHHAPEPKVALSSVPCDVACVCVCPTSRAPSFPTVSQPTSHITQMCPCHKSQVVSCPKTTGSGSLSACQWSCDGRRVDAAPCVCMCMYARANPLSI